MNFTNIEKSLRRLLIFTNLLFFSFSIPLLAQKQALSIGTFYGPYSQYNQIESTHTLSPFNILENKLRFDATFWNNNWGIGIGIQRVGYRLGFDDNDPIYSRRAAHIQSRGTFIPVNMIYRFPLVKVLKSPLYLYMHTGIIFSLNSFAIRDQQAYWQSLVRNWPDTIHRYNYYLNYDFHKVIIKLDLAIGLDYQILKNFSIGIEARYHQGLQKVGELRATYYPAGLPPRSVTVRHYGSAWMLGGKMQFHFLLNETSNQPVKLN